ncbi:MAG: outer membrane efflux protein [Candidatus Ozemobacter sibiricus]|uniref:Outer membrane efflux protein n=1 Tax=Candidatus Ozemobacter sibiricus TaxID=2268124 RepID=A0A367Z7D7_9BACT|nr:MAG: outer membrane efflux protein [Candidatus Ozemobacter sibiricus]
MVVIAGLAFGWEAPAPVWGEPSAAAATPDQSIPVDPESAPETPSSGLGLAEVVAMTLGHNPDILLQAQEVAGKQGAVQQAAGPFSPQLRSGVVKSRSIRPLTMRDRFGMGGRTHLPTTTTNYQIGYERLLRSGLVLRPRIEFTRNDPDLPGLIPENRGEVKFELICPLARGRGANAAPRANEDAARLDLEASRRTLEAAVQRSLFQAIDAYWSYVGSFRRLEIQRAAEDRARRLVEETEQLIKADHSPASERSQVEANLAAKQADRISSENTLRQDRRSLGLLLGIDAAAIEGLGPPLDAFPEPASLSLPVDLPPALVQETLDRRPELAELRLQARSAARLTAGSRSDERPRIDANLTVGYSGLDESNRFAAYFTPLSQRLPGLNVTFQVTADLPLKNDQAIGLRRQREAQEHKLAIALERAERDIRTGLTLAWRSVIDSLHQARCSDIAVRTYQSAVENEKAKLANGMSTLIDLINMEDRLTNALLSDIQARVNLARALNSLQYQAGRLVRRAEEGRPAADRPAPGAPLPPPLPPEVGTARYAVDLEALRTVASATAFPPTEKLP